MTLVDKWTRISARSHEMFYTCSAILFFVSSSPLQKPLISITGTFADVAITRTANYDEVCLPGTTSKEKLNYKNKTNYGSRFPGFINFSY